MKKALEARFLRLERDKKLQQQGFKCIYCYTPLTYSTATLEHKRSKHRGGTDRCENLAASCAACNKSKGSRGHNEFKREMARPECHYYLRQRHHVRKINLAAERAVSRILALVSTHPTTTPPTPEPLSGSCDQMVTR